MNTKTKQTPLLLATLGMLAAQAVLLSGPRPLSSPSGGAFLEYDPATFPS